MARRFRLLFALCALFLLVTAGLAAAAYLETAAPTGRIVLLWADHAVPADVVRVTALAGAAPSPRLAPDLVAALDPAAPALGTSATSRLLRYANVDATHLDRDGLVRLARRLAADPAVELAFLEPRAVPASLGFDAFTGESPAPVVAERETSPATSTTPDFTGLQGYLRNAPIGIGSESMWDQPGARGGSVRIIDVEGAWLWAHEDLPTPFADLGVHINDIGWRNHGTAVVAQMRGSDNGYGVIGIVPDSEVGNSSIAGLSVASALLAAAQHLSRGDLILIELHAPGPNSFEGGGQFGYLPMEYWPDNFDAIRAITDRGILVVEAAGNGEQDLDDPIYQNLFDRQVRDSGAIMVGATAGSALTPAWFTNHGTRVDLSGWGLNVVTAAYGNLQSGPETEWYTDSFSGTSSASPIVTGAVASLQGMVEAAFGIDLDAPLAAQILRETGTPTASSHLIGPRPDLVAAWAVASQGVGRLRGTVTAADGGQPLPGVVVQVLPDGPTITTGSDGSYHLALLPDTYDVTFSTYYHGTTEVVAIVATGDNVLNMSLVTMPLVAMHGLVRGDDLAPLGGVELMLAGEPVPAAFSNPDGTFTLPAVPAGHARLLIAGGSPGHGVRAVEIPADPPSLYLDVRLPPVTSDFEAGPDGFVGYGGLWQHGNPSISGIGPGRAFDGDLCWGIGLDGGGYPDNAAAELWSRIYTGDQLTGDRLYLSFHYWCGTEAGYDGVNVVLNPDTGGTVLHPLGGYTDAFLGGLGAQPGWSGTSSGWRPAIFDITDLLDVPTWQFALRFGSDEWVTDAGFLVDGVTLHAVSLVTAAPEDAGPPPAMTASLVAWPNPFNPRVTLAWSLPQDGRADLDIVDLRGRVVRQLLQDAPIAATGQVVWDGADRHGRALPSGVYLARLRTSGQAPAVQRLTLTR